MKRKPVLMLINLGTPDASDSAAVARYLREFLNDKFVIDIATPLRWLLVNAIIVPTRAKKSAAAYQKIWTTRGSPLRFNSVDFFEKMRATCNDFEMRLAMRYGSPSIESQVEEVVRGGASEIYFWPLYPQYALSSTEAALEMARTTLARLKYSGESFFIESFAESSKVAEVWSELIVAAARDFKPDHLLLSYHGLPIRHVKKISTACNGQGACSLTATAENKRCYRRQCYLTSDAIKLALFCRHRNEITFSPRDVSVAFQSRLTSGWIQPFSDEFYLTATKKLGVKRLLVACPSFVADCLETLEEVAMRGREEFISRGGEDLRLVPCLNNNVQWVDAAGEIARDKTKWQKLTI